MCILTVKSGDYLMKRRKSKGNFCIRAATWNICSKYIVFHVALLFKRLLNFIFHFNIANQHENLFFMSKLKQNCMWCRKMMHREKTWKCSLSFIKVSNPSQIHFVSSKFFSRHAENPFIDFNSISVVTNESFHRS